MVVIGTSYCDDAAIVMSVCAIVISDIMVACRATIAQFEIAIIADDMKYTTGLLLSILFKVPRLTCNLYMFFIHKCYTYVNACALHRSCGYISTHVFRFEVESMILCCL